jgi:TonB-like protein
MDRAGAVGRHRAAPRHPILLLSVFALVVACAGNPQPGRRTSAARRLPADTIGCLDTLHASDSIRAVVKIVVTSRDSAVRLPPDFENLFALEFRAHFKTPTVMPLSVVMGVPPCDSLGSRCIAGVLDAGAFAYATANSNGTLSDIEVVDVALTRPFADSVKSVLEAISSESLLPPIGDLDAIPLAVQLRIEQQPDSVPDYRRIFQMKIPRYDLPFTYASMPAAGVDAKFPMRARLAGVGDSVTVAFTVDADGTIPAESIELVKANYREFVSSVADALLHARYHPARLGDCAVATRMEQRFLFKVPD